MAAVWLMVAVLFPGQMIRAQGQSAAKTRARNVAANLTVITNNPEVSLYLNGAFRGKTDERGKLLIQRLPVGRYVLRARKIGFRNYRAEFRMVAGRSRQQRVNLLPTGDPVELAYQRGEQFREEKKYEESLSEYKNALEQRQPFPEARLGVARSLLALNRHEEAQQHAEQAIRERKGQDPEAYTVLANVLRGAGQYEDAVDNYRLALEQARNFSPEAHAGLAITLEFMDRPEEAIPHMRTAIAQNGDAEPILYNLLGNMLLRVEQKQEAIQAWERFLALAPESNLAPAIQSLVEQVREELAEEP